MLKLSSKEMDELKKELENLPTIPAAMLNGFACSASDTSCGCGWDCSSTKT